MSAILRCLILLLLMSSIIKASTAPALAGQALAANSAFSLLTIEPAVLHKGEEGHLYVKLKQATSQLTILNLTIRYPGGATQNVVHSTLGNEATLVWRVPADAGAGQASYQVVAGGCGCGDHSPTQADASQKMAEGLFTVE